MDTSFILGDNYTVEVDFLVEMQENSVRKVVFYETLNANNRKIFIFVLFIIEIHLCNQLENM